MPIPYITRIDYKRTRGWAVKFFRHNGRRVAKLFSDGQYGGKRKALEAAKAYRDDCQARGLIRPPGSHLPRTTADARNSTGHVGVCPIKRDGEVTAYMAYWSEGPYQQKREFFTVRKYGYRALEMAIACRRKNARRLRATARSS